MHLFKRQKKISDFFAAFVKSSSNLEHFEKKKSLIAYVFLKLETAKEVVS